MKMNIIRIWVDNTFVNIQTEKGTIYKERFADYPRLRNATPAQRADFEHDNIGIHWKSIDEDLSFNGFVKNNKLKTLIN